MANSVLSVFQGGTLTLANCFQDIGLALSAPNPMTADQTARLPVFYVADGIYSVRLVDQFGVEIYFYPQVPSIGASTSGGGGSAVDPTTIAQTGDPIWLPIDNTRAGWVRMNSRTIGSPTSGATERANNDAQNLFLYVWNNFTDALCPVISGRGVSAAADWAANKQITTLDMRGRGPYGLDTMGNTAAGVLTLANLGVDPTVASLAIGEEKHLLGTPELPTITPAGTNSAPVVTAKRRNRSDTFSPGSTEFITENQTDGNSVDNAVTASAPTFTGTPFGGGGTHNNTPPGRVGTWFQKL